MSGNNGADAPAISPESTPIDGQVNAFIVSFDKRTRRARHFANVLSSILSDLGGEDLCSAAQIELARRASALSVLAGDLDRAVVEGKDVDTAGLCALVNAQQRVLGRLGLRRVPRDVSAPDIRKYWDRDRAV